MAISTNQKPTIYRNLYENTGPELEMIWFFFADYHPLQETATEKTIYTQETTKSADCG